MFTILFELGNQVVWNIGFHLMLVLAFLFLLQYNFLVVSSVPGTAFIVSTLVNTQKVAFDPFLAIL